MPVRVTLTRVIHHTWIRAADAATKLHGFECRIVGRRTSAGLAEVEFSKVVIGRTPAALESLQRTLDRTLATAAPGHWDHSLLPPRIADELIKTPPRPPPVQWVREGTLSPAVWVGRLHGVLIGIISELDTGAFSAHHIAAPTAEFIDLSDAQRSFSSQN